VRLVLLTGVRIEQALGAPWSEFDLDKAEWHIAANRTGNKIKEPWLVPLMPEAVDMLRARANESPWVFPALGKDTSVARSQKDMKRIAHRAGTRAGVPARQDRRRPVRTRA
jgi:integrase